MVEMNAGEIIQQPLKKPLNTTIPIMHRSPHTLLLWHDESLQWKQWFLELHNYILQVLTGWVILLLGSPRWYAPLICLLFPAVQMMAQAHLSSLDMSSVDKDDASSGDEQGEDEENDHQTDSGRRTAVSHKETGMVLSLSSSRQI